MPGEDTFTLLMSDVDGSGARWEADAAANDIAMGRLDHVVLKAIAASGRLVKPRGEGDSHFVVFRDAAAAVAAAALIQQAIGAEEWPAGLPPPAVRIALHTGSVQERRGDYFGPAINRTARLRGIAHPGQVVMSGAARAAVDGRLPDGFALRNLGTHRLRDLIRPETVYQLDHGEPPPQFPPLRSEPRSASIPLPLTPLLGRDDLLADLRALLETSSVVTVTGATGVGKSRLAMEAAAAVADDAHGLAAVVSLGAPGGASESMVMDAAARLVQHADDGVGVLVLDDCDPVADAARRIAANVVDVDDRLRVVLTMRDAAWTPDATGPTVVVPPLEPNAARELFVSRAAENGVDVTFDDPVVGEVCALVGGVPLALELAAARASVVGVVTLRDRLRESDNVLRTVRRDGPAHHQSMAAARAWGGR